ncbi:MAG: hypothetical protein ACOX6P_05650 [Candidatus Merdivicinus sp.]
MLHRMLFHPTEKTVLILPDFIVRKYPQVRKLKSRHFFEEVYLFPYLQIPHCSEKQILEETIRCYQRTIPYPISSFSDIYVAGAHFYFSLYLIQNRIPFVFLEDAARMLSRPEELEKTLAKKYPLHAAIARKYGLFDGSNPLIQRVICRKESQTRDFDGSRYQDFSVEEALAVLLETNRKKVIRFFLKHRLWKTGDIILLTRHYASLGIMNEEEQRKLYEELRDGVLRGRKLIIKPHPDDTLDYRGIFRDAYVIRKIFPAELLPYVFRKKPEILCCLDSTGWENLRHHFRIWIIERKQNGKETNFDTGQFCLSVADSYPHQRNDGDRQYSGSNCDRCNTAAGGNGAATEKQRLI